MGKRLNISQTTVIQTELIPLTDNFELIPNGLTEQWFYENTNVFKPDRQITPLIITPKVTAVDEDTHITYQPSLYIVQWYALEYNGTAWVETEITNITQGLQYDYVKVDNTLQVNKNISDATHGVQIKCRAQYSDPRDNGIVYAVEETISLTANKDATIIYPTIDILNESAQSYNPLGDRSSQFTFKGIANWDGVPNPSENIIKYAVDPKGTEAIIPDNESALVTSAPTMDIRYGKGSGSVLKENQQFMYRQVSGGTVSPIGSNLAYVEKIKGNTVKFNQRIKDPVGGTQDSLSQSGGLVITYLNGISKVTGGTATNTNFTLKRQGALAVIGHIYYCVVVIKTSVALGVYLAGGSGSFALIDPNTDFTRYAYRYNNQYAGAANGFGFYPNSPTEAWEAQLKYAYCIDLTNMFGAGNEPTAQQFEQWLAVNIGLKPYYPYNAGELISVKMSAIKSVGFNIWDEKIVNGKSIDINSGEYITDSARISSANYIPVMPNTNYYIKVGNISSNGAVAFYDKNKNYVSGQSFPVGAFTTPANAVYMKFSPSYLYGRTYNHDICINLSDASRNGTYEAHWEAEQYLPITELKGKVNGQGDSVVIFPDGMNYLSSTVFDEIKVEDGVIKAVKRCGMVNMGIITWEFVSSPSWNCFRTSVPKANGRRNFISQKYEKGELFGTQTDKIMDGNSDNVNIYIRDSFYNGDYTAFKTAMDGVYLVYELATPVEYIIDNMPRGQFEWYGVKNGTEVKIDTLPCYVSGQHTDTIVVDAMYSENLAVILRIKELAGDLTCLPPRAQRTVAWRTPNVDSIITSDKGGAVRSDSEDFTFGTIVNTQGQTLSDDKIDANLRFKWSTRKSNGSSVIQRGWGRNITLQKADLINVRGVNNTLASTHVDNEVYLLGAYEEVTYDGEALTYSGSPLFGRPLDEEN